MVALKVTAGTQDYAFFAQAFQVQSLPSIHIIHKGMVSAVFDKQDAELTPASFATRLGQLIGFTNTSETQTETVPGTENGDGDGPVEPQTGDPGSERESVTNHTGTSSTQPDPAQAQPSAPATARSTPVPGPASTPPATKPASPTASGSSSTAHDATTRQYQESLRQKRKQEREERNRILKLLEADREERRHQATLRKNSPTQPQSSQSQSPTPPPAESKGKTATTTTTSTKKRPEECALLVRLFDGTPIKHKFKATESLVDVRAWVDEFRTDGTHPYAFFQPMGKKLYGDGEESHTLLELDLAPSASLVLKPAGGSVSAAYEAGTAGGPYQMLQQGASMVGSALYTFLGIGYRPPPRDDEQPIARDSHEARQIRAVAAAAAQSRTISLDSNSSDTENEMLNAAPAAVAASASSGANSGSAPTGTSSVVRSGYSTPRANLYSVPSSSSINRLGMNASASNSTSNLANVRTIHSAPEDGDRDEDPRHTYNGNHLSLEDKKDPEEKEKNNL